MTKVSLSTIKNWFRTLMKPTQEQFWDTWDSFWHKDETLPISSVENLTSILNSKADYEQTKFHTNNKNNPHEVTAQQIGAISIDKLIEEAQLRKEADNALQDEIDELSKITSIRQSVDSYAALQALDISTFRVNDGVIVETDETYQNKVSVYTWSGTEWVWAAEISGNITLGETSVTAYRGDRGKIAYDHSQIVTGNPHKITKTDVGLGNADNTSDANKPISTLTQTALNNKADKTELSDFVKRKETSNNTTVVNTNLLTWERTDGTGVGTIKINLPNGWIGTMLMFEIDFYNYNANAGSKLFISGYCYHTSSSWVNCKTNIWGSFPYAVRLAYDSQTGKCCILLGNTTTRWEYPGFSLSKVVSRFGSAGLWSAGYSCELITDESKITKIVTPAIDTHTHDIAEVNALQTALDAKAPKVHTHTAGEITGALALGETSGAAYRGDRGKIAYDHSQLVTGNPHKTTKADVGLGNVDNTSDANKPISTPTQTVLNSKADKTELSEFVKRKETSDNTTFVNTNLLTWERQDSTGVGTIKINLPNGWVSTMLMFEIDFYNFNAHAGSKLLISGYCYKNSTIWSACKTSILGAFPYTVRLAYDSQTGKCCILLGNTTTKWEYPGFSLSKVVSRFFMADLWSTGYSCELITDESKLTKIVTPAIDTINLQQITDNGDTTTKEITAPTFKGTLGDGNKTITLVPQHSNEVNFGGSSTGTTIHFGLRATDSRPKPTMFSFGYLGDASVKAAGVVKTGSSDNYVLLGGGGHKLLSEVDASLIEVGGVNYILNSNFYDKSHWRLYSAGISYTVANNVATVTFGATNNIIYSNDIQFYKDQEYILSADIRSDAHTTLSYNYLISAANGNQSVPPITGITTQWKRYSVKVKLTADRLGGIGFGGKDGIFQFRNVQLEKGNKASDYRNNVNDVRVMPVSLTANNTTAVGHAYCDMADINIPDLGTKTIIYYPKAGIVTVLVINVAVNLAAPVVFKVGSTVLTPVNVVQTAGKYTVTLLSSSDTDAAKVRIIVNKQ